MLLALYGLPDAYSHVRNQFLSCPNVPTMDSTWSTLLRVPNKALPEVAIPIAPLDSSTLVSHQGNRARHCKPSKSHFKCDHCHKLSHTIDRCYALHGRPPRTANITHNTQAVSSNPGLRHRLLLMMIF